MKKDMTHDHGTDTASDRAAQVREDLEELYLHVGDIVREGASDMQARWRAMQRDLEAKRGTMIVRSQRLRGAGSAASAELKEGFETAYQELKDAIEDARAKFS